MITKTILDNINCEGCVRNIKKTLSNTDGIADIIIDIPSGEVTIEHEEKVSVDGMLELLDNAGYPEK